MGWVYNTRIEVIGRGSRNNHFKVNSSITKEFNCTYGFPNTYYYFIE